jgi:ArsR family transcriptional regulator
MLPHDRETYRQQMGHVWLGFGEDALQRMLGNAGFDHVRVAPMPTDTEAKGPALFVASARKKEQLRRA